MIPADIPALTEDEVLNSLSDLVCEDIQAALRHAAEDLQERELPLVNIG